LKWRLKVAVQPIVVRTDWQTEFQADTENYLANFRSEREKQTACV